MLNRGKNSDYAIARSGIDVTLNELIALRHKVTQRQIEYKGASQESMIGSHHTKIRGRGIEFDATREYQPGDDIRRMAWRVTARSLKPHIKIYHEEKERPVWLGVDLSPSLYFGTRTMFKSVASITTAAHLGWLHLQKRNRVGASMVTPNNTFSFRPLAREREFLKILKTLAELSVRQGDFTEPNCLQQLLLTLQKQTSGGHLIYIISDFFQFDESNQKIILHLAQKAHVHCIFVYDPFEAEPPPPYQYLLTDGQKTATFDMNSPQHRIHYQQQFKIKLQRLVSFMHQHAMPFETLCTTQKKGKSK